MDDGHGAVSLGRATLEHATAKAILVVLEDGERLWVPKKCVSEDSEVYWIDDEENGTEGELFVHRWWAEKEGRG